ncbi:formyltetrahydrofolate deformylase [Patulibacter medicamentivorans]|uniref:formyltetrahydrofolate deformylase n=1 Tax=Patulibacter medicamentivorans TaxID=1097667 RepID=UPI001110A77E|nr:formyltetrahydrofolate deformylase [Patulibacter medicamentivorans]
MPEPSDLPTGREAPPEADVSDVGRLLVRCPDGPGIVAAVSGLLHAHGANIAQSDQYSTSLEGGTFLMRVVFHLPGLAQRRAHLERAFAERVAADHDMTWSLHDAARPKRAAILVSREDHCLLDLLWRTRRGELELDVGLVVSNHDDLRRDVEPFGIDYHHVPITPDTKPAAEQRLLELLDGQVDVVILARYMQILSGDLLERLGVPVINIHHSFLPAFVGAQPYAQARARGVKLVGATAHYVTEELDAGPIIEQDVARVSHRDDVPALIAVGRDIERTVLARAVAWHAADRVIVHDGTTVVL